MMYDELIKRLRTATTLPVMNALCQEAADAIEEQQAAEKKYIANIGALETENQHLKREREWMPVTERLPENDNPVLCWYEYYHWSKEKVLPEYGIGYCTNEYWGGEVSNGRDCRVLFWMPLPTPPKEE